MKTDGRVPRARNLVSKGAQSPKAAETDHNVCFLNSVCAPTRCILTMSITMTRSSLSSVICGAAGDDIRSAQSSFFLIVCVKREIMYTFSG